MGTVKWFATETRILILYSNCGSDQTILWVGGGGRRGGGAHEKGAKRHTKASRKECTHLHG